MMSEQPTWTDDQPVWEAFLRGDLAAFDKIYTRYFLLLFRYGLRFTADRELLKDVLQDLFVELFSRRQGAPLVSSLRSYLMVCMRRKLFRTERSPAHSLNNLWEGEEYDFSLELSPEQHLIEDERLLNRQKLLQKAIRKLTSRQKEAVYLYFYENMGYEEITRILDMKEVKYTRTLVYRAVAALRKELQHAESALLLLWMMRHP